MSYNTGAQRVPAWKRLGLKLKGPAAGEDTVSAPSSGNATGHPTQASQQRNVQNPMTASPASALKRKQQAPLQTPSKKIRLDEQPPASAPSTLKRQKSVTFTEDTKEVAKAEKEKKPKQPKKKKEPKKQKKKNEAPQSDFSLEPALAYLRQWHTDRQSWKFNKNHQTLLIKYLFDPEKIPSADISTFYLYIRDLKGFVRTRLRETAQEIKKQDMEQGAEAFPASTKNKETKQKEYEAALSDFIKTQQQLQQLRQQNEGGASVTNANGKRTFDEVELVIRIANPEVKQRLLKRMRAEMVLDELSDSESTMSTDTTMTTTSTTSSTADKQIANGDDAVAKRPAPVKLNDGSTQPAKRRRLRSIRTEVRDDESSSDSDSDDESGSSDSSDDDDDEKSGDEEDSSSSSSSDDDSDEEMVSNPEQAEGDESSSSSSSSSESESEEAATEGGEAGDSSSSESSDSDDD
ncbi:hypothetical protein QBC37DRAFT_409685 [Rhypophila decipiens]|uniref:WKF domain-containing protein n=1 Tax=Rhypophila decipiens TaxID=261697 RepID=A0AAN6YI77_9PEZI|nr:hypothetical protein QBC37DRAFT_409685 [Rhypophila decipiens]